MTVDVSDSLRNKLSNLEKQEAEQIKKITDYFNDTRKLLLEGFIASIPDSDAYRWQYDPTNGNLIGERVEKANGVAVEG